MCVWFALASFKSLLNRFLAFAPGFEVVARPGFPARDLRPSYVISQDDDLASQQMIGDPLVLKAIAASIANPIACTVGRPDSCFYNVFPGEHYRFLQGLVQELAPRSVVEIGTYTGMSARVILDAASLDFQLHTYDLLPWSDFSSHLTDADFESGRLQQHLDDLSIPSCFEAHLQRLNDAELIFCDGPKDGMFEYRFLRLLAGLELSYRRRYLVLDDIRFVNMLALWRSIESPKLDLTSFGHWSGTGLVDLSAGLKLRDLDRPGSDA